MSVLALLLVACKPLASFDVSPDEVKVGAEATFDASTSSASPKPRGNTLVSYAWEFGDGATGTGKIVKHTYTQAGSYVVTLRVTDKAGRISLSSQTLKVIDAPAHETASVQVITQIAGGVLLPGVEVRIGDTTALSGAEGVANLTEVALGDDHIIQASKRGYITQAFQAIVTANGDDQRFIVVMLPEKDTLNISAIEAAQTLRSNYLNASVTLPANALVTATGTPVTGPAVLKLSPWDISGVDMQAIPGNGSAIDANGTPVDLIGAAMISVEFFDTAGNKLQVAQDKSAVIQVDLPTGTTSVGGNPVAEGTTIPLWHFDQDRGLWIREGTGTVVNTTTGLAARAEVAHFSTWSAGYALAPVGLASSRPVGFPGTVTPVKCVDASEAPVACQVTVKATWPDGSHRFWHASLSATTRYFVNLPANADLLWEARTATGLLGAVSTGVGSEAIIVMRAPASNNFVQCQLSDGSSVPCSVVASTADSAGLSSVYVPAGGAQIATGLTGTLNWNATFQGRAPGETTHRTYQGSATSGTTGSVVITLNVAGSEPEDTQFFVRCAANTSGNGNHSSVTLTKCDVLVTVYDADSTVVEQMLVSGLGSGSSVSFSQHPGGYLKMAAEGQRLSSATGLRPVAYYESPLDNIAYGQLIELELEAFYPL